MDEKRRYWKPTDSMKSSQPLAFHQTIQIVTRHEFEIFHHFSEASAL